MNVTEMLSDAREAMTVKRVYGDPIERDGLTIVPAADVRGGGGGGGDSENNGGGGFGLSARPVGVYVVKDGEVAVGAGGRRQPHRDHGHDDRHRGAARAALHRQGARQPLNVSPAVAVRWA